MRALLFAGIILTTLDGPAAMSQTFRSIESRSGQFIVRWRDQFRVPPLLRQDEEKAGVIVMSPELLTVSAERIKEGLLQQLGTTDRWRGKIRFHFASGKSDPNRFQVRSTRFTNGWSYQVTLSAKIKRTVWLRGCVAVCLLEMGNRMAQSRSIEVPMWLIEGATVDLAQSALVDLSPSYARQVVVGGNNPELGRITAPQQPQDPLISTRQFLSQNVPVSATELFFPDIEHLSGNRAQAYRQSAHFFFRQLAALPAGKASLQLFLVSLPDTLNWQKAFFASYEESFSTMLDLEKWWSVALTDLTQLTPVSSWSLSESLRYLDRILTSPALVGQDRDEIAQRRNFKLTEVVDQWPFTDQQPTLEQTMNRLRVLSIYAAPDLRPMIRGYLTAIQQYLEERRKVGFERDRPGQARLTAKRVVRNIQTKLKKLDAQRRAMRNA